MCTCTYTWHCEKAEFWLILKGQYEPKLKGHPDAITNLSLSFLTCLYFCLSLTLQNEGLLFWSAFHETDTTLGFSFALYVEAFRSSLCKKVLTSAIFFYTMTSVLLSSTCECFHTWAGLCSGVWWVCLVHMYPASIFQFFLWAIGLSSTLQTEMAFDNGWNTQMPGRHFAIDHSSEGCVHSPCSPAGEQY